MRAAEATTRAEPDAAVTGRELVPSTGARASSADLTSSPDLTSSRDLKRRKRGVRLRRYAARALVAVPAVGILLSDFLRRGPRLAHLAPEELVFYALSAIATAAVWGGLLVVASRRTGKGRWVARAALAAGALFALGAQSYMYMRYSAYMDHQAVLVGTSMMPSVGQQLWSDRATFAKTLLPPVVVALALPLLVASLAPARRRRALVALDVGMVALIVTIFTSPAHGGEQGQPPDAMYLSAMGQLARARWDHNETVERLHPGPRAPIPVPPLSPKPAATRNVLVVLTESVRAQSTCVAYTEGCVTTPFSNAAAPRRFPLTQMRAVDSTTAISLAVMWGGLAPDETREDLHAAPLVWEYAHAAGLDTAYWTSQNLLFGNSGTWVDGLPLTRFVSATEIEPDASMEVGADDGKLVDRVLGDLGGLREPFVGVVHLSNTHFPYKVDPAFMPFEPQEEATGPGYESEIKNRYQDAIYLQDRAVGRLLTELRARPVGARTVVVFVSDHGEQMREKGAVGHTGTLFEEEIRIPAWIDAPPGTLTASEEDHLRALADAPLTSLDVLPTLLDLAGLWDAPQIAPFRARMPGAPLLRGGSSPERPVFLTNCTQLWACAFKNWGAMRGTRKAIANQGDHAWNCYDVATDPFEHEDLGDAACADLRALAETRGHGRPF